MNLIDLLLTASNNMLRSKVRTSLTIIAIFIGAMTITLTNGIGTGIKSYLNRQVGNLGATNTIMIQPINKNASGPAAANSGPAKYNPDQKTAAGNDRRDARQIIMSAKDITNIKSIPGIDSVEAERPLSPDYIAAKNDKFVLTAQRQYGVTTADMLAGRGVDNTSVQNQITIPESYVKPLGYNNNQSILGETVTIGVTTAVGKSSQVSATVVGIQQKTLIGSISAYVNKPLADQIYAIQSDGLPKTVTDSFVSVTATFPSNYTDAQVGSLKDALKAKGYDGQTIKDRENTVFTVINVVIIVFDMFGAIALLAASFGIINTLFMAVQERTKEIGLMKALGMSPKRIFTLFSIEAVLLGFWGSVLGVALAALIGRVVNSIATKGFLKDFPGLTLLTFPLTTIVVVIASIMLIAFLAGTLPALRASKKDPIEALRYE